MVATHGERAQPARSHRGHRHRTAVLAQPGQWPGTARGRGSAKLAGFAPAPAMQRAGRRESAGEVLPRLEFDEHESTRHRERGTLEDFIRIAPHFAHVVESPAVGGACDVERAAVRPSGRDGDVLPVADLRRRDGARARSAEEFSARQPPAVHQGIGAQTAGVIASPIDRGEAEPASDRGRSRVHAGCAAAPPAPDRAFGGEPAGPPPRPLDPRECGESGDGRGRAGTIVLRRASAPGSGPVAPERSQAAVSARQSTIAPECRRGRRMRQDVSVRWGAPARAMIR